ncbi:MAG: hypothetical protein JWP27_1631 [Flaviaesturariibacter sp.]|nr:hypothetical protein [Flaviaesturariibacter sp.]
MIDPCRHGLKFSAGTLVQALQVGYFVDRKNTQHHAIPGAFSPIKNKHTCNPQS